MNASKRLARVWLRIPERGVDVISILLASAGINLVTMAPNGRQPGIAMLSGSAVIVAGVLAAILKDRAASIRSTVNSRIEADDDAVQRYLSGDGGGEKPSPRSRAQHLKATVSDFLQGSPEAASVGRNVMLIAVFSLAGITIAFWPLVVPDRREEDKARERAESIETMRRRLASLEEEFDRVFLAVDGQANELDIRTQRIVRELEVTRATVEAGWQDHSRHVDGELAGLHSKLHELVEAIRNAIPPDDP